jgi:hypothetical protein
MNASPTSAESAEQTAWNRAYERLQNFLDSFALSDRAEVSRLALKLFDQARELHRRDPSRDPATLVMEQAQKLVTDWLATNLDERDKPPSQIFSSGCIALLLSGLFRTAPAAFLASPLPDDLRQSMRRTLLVTGPDFNISSMTPRRIDYGPMLTLARQTWHRWNTREILIAMLFWSGVYFVFYWWLSDLL